MIHSAVHAARPDIVCALHEHVRRRRGFRSEPASGRSRSNQLSRSRARAPRQPGRCAARRRKAAIVKDSARRRRRPAKSRPAGSGTSHRRSFLYMRMLRRACQISSSHSPAAARSSVDKSILSGVEENLAAVSKAWAAASVAWSLAAARSNKSRLSILTHYSQLHPSMEGYDPSGSNLRAPARWSHAVRVSDLFEFLGPLDVVRHERISAS